MLLKWKIRGIRRYNNGNQGLERKQGTAIDKWKGDIRKIGGIH